MHDLAQNASLLLSVENSKYDVIFTLGIADVWATETRFASFLADF